MPTSNELLRDALIGHQISLLRVSGSLKNRIIELLDATEADLRQQMDRRLESIVARGFDTGKMTTNRIAALIEVLAGIRNEAWKDVTKLLGKELATVAKAEPIFVSLAISASLPVVVDFVLPSAERIKQVVLAEPFEGRILSDWAKSLQASDVSRIEQQIKIGLVQGEPTRAIIDRVVGTSGLSFTDGVTQVTRNQADAVVRTAVNHVSNKMKEAFYLENAKILNKEVYVATLDSRTTLICASLDGKTFAVGKGPRPPQHFRCRSVRVAVIDGEAIGTRPSKRASKADLEGLSAQERRAKIREMTGPVPAKTTYSEFLSRQTVDFQNEVLGVTKGKLFRKGGLTLDKFVDKAGNELTIVELMKKERAAFERAGLLN